jgi:hypothetical protein
MLVAWRDIKDGESFTFNGHQISRWGDQIHVFGNDRNFPVPPGYRLVEARIGLVNSHPDPERSKMPLPEALPLY